MQSESALWVVFFFRICNLFVLCWLSNSFLLFIPTYLPIPMHTYINSEDYNKHTFMDDNFTWKWNSSLENKKTKKLNKTSNNILDMFQIIFNRDTLYNATYTDFFFIENPSLTRTYLFNSSFISKTIQLADFLHWIVVDWVAFFVARTIHEAVYDT